MLNVERQGCVAAFHNTSGYDLDMFYLYVDSVTNACAQKPNEGIDRAINQTSKGALSVYYKGKDKNSFETWCMCFKYNQNVKYYIGLNTECNCRFLFGKFMWHIFPL